MEGGAGWGNLSMTLLRDVCPCLLLLRRWRKVGWIWAQSTKEREFIMSSEEICQCAAVQVRDRGR